MNRNTLNIGDVCQLVELQNDVHLNGMGCTVLTPLVNNEVFESGGKLVRAERYGIRLFNGETGYIRPHNLIRLASFDDPARIRAVWIHLTGREPKEEEL